MLVVQESVNSSHRMDCELSQQTREDIYRLKELELAHSVQVFEQAANNLRRKVGP